MAENSSKEILDKINEQSVTLESHITKTEVWQDAATVHMTNIDIAVNGNGKPGLKIDVDRLKQTEKSMNKFIWLAIGASIVAVVTQVASHFGPH